MHKDRFVYLCRQTEAGRDAFVRHSGSHEEGMITGCDLHSGMMLVQTPEKQTRRWGFEECQDLEHRKTGPMI